MDSKGRSGIFEDRKNLDLFNARERSELKRDSLICMLSGESEEDERRVWGTEIQGQWDKANL